METSSTYHKEFKVMIKKIVKQLWRRLDEQRDKKEVINMELENIKNHIVINNIVNGIGK